MRKASETARWEAGELYRHAPLQFALKFLRMGEPGPYEDFRRRDPDDPFSVFWPWQSRFLAGYGQELADKGWGPDADGNIVDRPSVQRCIVSATGTGKTALVLPLLIVHALVCFPRVRGIAMSASGKQLKSKLYSATKLMIESSPELSEWLGWREAGPYLRSSPEETNYLFTSSGTESSGAGTHGLAGMTHQTVDQAEGTKEDAWMGAAGARQNKQSVQVVAGNPWSDAGWFWRRHEGDLAATWNPVRVNRKDPDDCPEWTAEQDAEALRTYGGEESPKYRQNVLGLPALRGMLQFIPEKLVREAATAPLFDEQGRPLEASGTPCVVGMDLARGGRAFNCAVWRRGSDARSVLPEERRGTDMGTDELVAWAVDVASRPRPPFPAPARVYFDATGERGDFLNALRQTDVGHKFVPVDFAGQDPAGLHHQLRGALWTGLREWFGAGGRIRNDGALINTICAAREVMIQGKPGIIPKDEIRRKAGHTRLDEVDALLLAVRQPPRAKRGSRLRGSSIAPPARPRGYGY